MTSSVHTVQLVYTAPWGNQGDMFTTVAVFTSEDRARLFVAWAERQRKEVFTAYHRLEEEVGIASLSDKLNVHSLIRMILPTNGYGSDHYHFQYDDEFDLDPPFG